MDPVGPWSAYASYNRLTAGVSATTTAGELHHLPSSTTGGTPPVPATTTTTTTTTQLLPGGFLSSPQGAYDVFTPFFHHAGTKPPAHYVTQRQSLSKQPEGEFHQTPAFFEQNHPAWQQNSPFGILPHESVVPTTTAKGYENFNAHFAAQSINHLNSLAAKNATARVQSPQVVATTTKSQGNATFFQVPVTFTISVDSSVSKQIYATTNAQNIQQSCIVTSSNASIPGNSRGVPVTGASSRAGSFLPSNAACIAVTKPSSAPQVQTKAQIKVYPEIAIQNERNNDEQQQSSPISFSMDAPRLSYANSTSNNTNKRPFQTNYRHYQQGSNNESSDFQRVASVTTNGNSDCNIAVSRRSSPLLAHSQASPIGHAPSPVYPQYNSPMSTSISSPQSNNHMTPPSPLDASVPRPSPQSNIAYSSVITRALNTDKQFPERFERQNQVCWEDRRKFNAYNATNTTVDVVTSRTESVPRQAGNVTISEHQAYFDGQVPLQDLSSCRGDPMSIVKNLQQQQSCHLQQVEIKQEVKKRKSDEKDSRMPPPAHSTGANQPPPPVPQNGTFYYSDRWNLQSASKIFTSQNLPQHQGLIIHPHGHHPPPPIPYFTPYHLPTSHPTEYPSSVELTPLSNYSESPTQTAHYQQQIDAQPKVVVPNIEEELKFLNGSNPLTISRPPQLHQSKTINPPNIAKPADVKSTGPGAGFMSSYIKFLQGERDSSPPPSARAPRTYSRTKIVKENKDSINGVKPILPPITQPPPPPPVITRLSQGDPQDDPRYFPLPKERKQNSFDTSDDGISSDDDIFRKMPPLTKDGVVKTGKKGRPCKAGGPKDKKKIKTKIKSKMKVDNVTDITDVPRRETCKRAAKDRVHLQNIITKGETIDEPEDFADSDSDPAWTPAAKEDVEEEVPSKKGKRKFGGKKKATRNLITAAAEGAGIQVDNIEDYLSDSSMTQTKKQKAAYQVHKTVNNPARTLEDNIEANLVQQHNNIVRSAPVLNNNGNTTYPFKPGEFVAVESELTQNWPIIWRFDGKSRLQKYQPFIQNGNTLYKNISTYTSWTPDSKNQYISIPVRFHSQNNLEIIVEFMKHEVMVPNPEFISKCIKECEIYQDNFEVYIQTLISQSLDSNFLTEIFQEQDEYFLSNVKVIDDITINKKNKLIGALRWPSQLQAALSTWPCFNLTKDFLTKEILSQNCAACKQPTVSIRLLLYGQPYNSTTLEGCAPDPKAINDKDFVMCRLCGNNVELFNKITHQKYLMYIECAKRVTDKRTMDPRKDTTCILNELLADESWLNQLFSMVRTSWANVESVERNFLMRHLKSDTNSVVK
ncbi:PREDICTED: uncharacterized protein LOC108562042 isoform X2 [Nicrophorus vespilloides]|uniref:Uncharacterized protein LOC108562042 isoform X2 n=1 Tax=Nicrophorus vespilloides TaxID=110193 RepID=A0ABM1MMB2_NICVS|nr:PREDICTED: uncharacterized protein LOC108562042 isoform X2 [Nicrophorus vespilloides]